MTLAAVPPVLYKYTTSSTALLVLRGGRLRWSSPILFNDLAEFQRMPRFKPALAESFNSYLEVIADSAAGRIRVDHDRLSRGTRLLLSLTECLLSKGFDREQLVEDLRQQQPVAPDDVMDVRLREVVAALNVETARVLCVTPTFDNDVMWGTYAGSHTGCVLGFAHLPERSTPLLEARPVHYCEQPPIVGSGLEFLLYGDTQELRARTLDAICFSKKAGWAYENEWRAMTWRPAEVGQTFSDFKFYPEELDSVTLGARADAATVEAVSAVLSARYPKAAVYRIVGERGVLRRERLDNA